MKISTNYQLNYFVMKKVLKKVVLAYFNTCAHVYDK